MIDCSSIHKLTLCVYWMSSRKMSNQTEPLLVTHSYGPNHGLLRKKRSFLSLKTLPDVLPLKLMKLSP